MRTQIVSQIVSLRVRASSAVCECRLGRQQQCFYEFSRKVGVRVQNTSKPCKGIQAMLWSTGFSALKAIQTSAYLLPVQIHTVKSARKQARANGISHRRFVVSLSADLLAYGSVWPVRELVSFSALSLLQVPARAWANFAPRPRCGGGKRTGVFWFRNDLRLQDHDALGKANQEALTVLPVFCFDPRLYGKVIRASPHSRLLALYPLALSQL